MRNELKGIVGINRHELEYLYDEIFIRQTYLRHGLHLANDAVVFDIGANIGMFSLFVRSRSSAASIYAFEPIPPIFKALEHNVGGSSRDTHLFCCGVANAHGEAQFTYYPGYSMMSVASSYADTDAEKELVRRHVLKEQRRDEMLTDEILETHLASLLDYRFQETRYQCPLCCVSDIIDQYSVHRIDFLKVDVQRSEIDVLEGIRDDHWPVIRQIAMEVHDGTNPLTAGRADRISAMLGARGFNVIVEQEEPLSGTDRHVLFARRPSS